MASYSFKSGTWDSKNQDWVIPAIPQEMVDEFDQLGGHEILWAEAMDFVADHQEFGPYAEILKAEEEDPDVEIDYDEALEISREWVKALLRASYGEGVQANPGLGPSHLKVLRAVRDAGGRESTETLYELFRSNARAREVVGELERRGHLRDDPMSGLAMGSLDMTPEGSAYLREAEGAKSNPERSAALKRKLMR